MRLHLSLPAALIAGSALFVACSSTPVTPDEEEVVETEQPEDAEPTAEEWAQSRTIPELSDLVFMDNEPEIVELGEADGVSSFKVGNVQILHMPTPANEVVAARLYLRGGSMNLNESLQGIEQLALSVAVNGGTESTTKDEFNTRLDAIGSSVGSISDRDFSGFTMNSVRDHFDETWELFEEAIFEPAFPDDEVELRRNRQLASIDTIADDPDRLVSEVARDLAYTGHPYFFRQLGNSENVQGFTTDQLRAWHRSLLAPERMLLVVVGNIDRDELVEKVQHRLGRLASTDLRLPTLPDVAHDGPAMRVETMELPTNYILGYFAAPTMGHADYAAMLLATRHLRSRLFEEVRTKRNLTYAVSSGMGNRGANVGFLYVTAVDPAATMPVIFDEIEKLKNEPISEKELEEVRNVFLTSHYMGLETNSSVAGQLARAELIGGDWSISTRFLDSVNSVTPEDIQRVVARYIQNTQFGIVGDPDDVPGALFGVQTDDVETVDEVEDPVEPPAEPDEVSRAIP